MMDVELNSCFSKGEGKNRMVISFFFSGLRGFLILLLFDFLSIEVMLMIFLLGFLVQLSIASSL